MGLPRDVEAVSLLSLGQAVLDEVGDPLRGRRVHIRQHHNRIVGLRTNFEIAVHAGSTATMAKAANASSQLLAKAIGIFAPSWKAGMAILFSFVTKLIYLAFRFEWRFG